MNRPEPPTPPGPTYEPSRPTLAATGLLSIWIFILSLPMFAGKFLGSPFSDQWKAGYAFRLWGTEQWKATGHVPLWNPNLFGGLPFVAAMHGDIFYPTAWLRLILPTAFVMNIEFPVHYLLAGVFAYLLLRRLKASWTGAVTGAFAYQLSGVIVSYVAPGHDGKLYVTALLPLMLIGLIMGQREKKFEGFALCAIVVGLALVSPQAQMAYYMLLTSGLFALYLAFGENDKRTMQERVVPLLLSLVAVILGFGIGMIQMLPFLHYQPFSPRATEGAHDFQWATSYAIPWVHVPEFFLSGFVGRSEAGTYWGTNGIKFHSEYLGLPVVALAVAGWRSPGQRRLIWWLTGIGALFLLIAMGSATPFYSLWYAVGPFVSKTRAPGMALYIVSLVLAVFAAFGVQRIETRESTNVGQTWLIVGGVLLVLAAGGLFGGIADSLARSQMDASPQFLAQAAQAATGAQSDIRLGAAGSAIGLALLGLLAFAWASPDKIPKVVLSLAVPLMVADTVVVGAANTWLGVATGACWIGVAGLVAVRRRINIVLFAMTLPIIVSADLWRAGRDFWMYEDAPTRSLFAPDTVTSLLMKEARPYRVLDIGVYPGATLMAFGIPNVLGHHGNELDAFDKLMGGQDQWDNAGSPGIWRLYAAKYLIIPAGQSPDSVPGYHIRLKNVPTTAGRNASVFEADVAPSYARLVPAAMAIKAPQAQVIGALINPRFSSDGIVTLDSNSTLRPAPVATMPAPLAVKANVTKWAPGSMTIQLQPAAPQAAYLLVSENWYPDWTATVDGKPAQVVRGDVALITVPVPAGAKEVSLLFISKDYATGRAITLISCLIALAGVVVPPVLRRRARSDG